MDKNTVRNTIDEMIALNDQIIIMQKSIGAYLTGEDEPYKTILVYDTKKLFDYAEALGKSVSLSGYKTENGGYEISFEYKGYQIHKFVLEFEYERIKKKLILKEKKDECKNQ